MTEWSEQASDALCDAVPTALVLALCGGNIRKGPEGAPLVGAFFLGESL